MCRISPSSRYDANKVLRHPWITRDSQSPIPESLVESFSRHNRIKKFQHAIGALIALNIFKATHINSFTNLKKKPIVKKLKLKDINSENIRFETHQK
jgi:hypothetical protein